MDFAYHPHDLLWVNALDDQLAQPEWFSLHDLKQRPVVVRRAPNEADRIAIGIRGFNRSQRHASYVKPSDIVCRMTPESLVEAQNWHELNRTHPLPHWRTLNHINQIMASYSLRWGITGSLGFELATLIPTANEKSDIDLRLLCSAPIEQSLCRKIYTDLNFLEQRPDIQIETPNGAFAMNEWITSSDKTVLVKSHQGPYLSSSPWSL